MARGINKVILVGNLGADPEVRTTNGGLEVANLRLATSESWRDKQSGQMTDRTEWHRVVLFGNLAKIAQQYLRKGSQIYIEGKIQTRKWQDKQSGQDRFSTEIVANEMTMLGGGGRGAGGDMGSGSRGGDSYPPDDYGSDSYANASSGSGSYASASGGSVSHGGGGGGSGAGGGGREDFDDDIPF